MNSDDVRVTPLDMFLINNDVEIDDVFWIKIRFIRGDSSNVSRAFIKLCCCGSIKMMKYYLERYVININGPVEEYAFFNVCQDGKLNIAMFLVNYGFQPNDLKGNFDWSETGKLVKFLSDKDIEDLNKLFLILTEEGYSYTYPIQTRNGIRCIKIAKYGRCRSENMELFF